MFKFDFNAEEFDENDDVPAELESNLPALAPKEQVAQPSRVSEEPFLEVTIDKMIDTLPEIVSYSPLVLSGGVIIPRRDLFDARFQLISEDNEDAENGKSTRPSASVEFIDAPSDLVPGVYEGGLKTWECSIDLVNYLHSKASSLSFDKVIEIGCGTAIPSLYVLQTIFSRSAQSGSRKTTIHLQDYNRSVLELVTLPNIILSWYFSPASRIFREAQTPPIVDLNPAEPSEVNLTSELLTAFRESLKHLDVSLRFFSGSWSTFDHAVIPPNGYDLVLTSETIYQTTSLPSLLSLLQAAYRPPSNTSDISDRIQEATVTEKKCLVAAKIVYFGVGGGVSEFERVVRVDGGQVETVWEKKDGVGRRVMNVEWNVVPASK